MSGNRYAAERGINAGREGLPASCNPFRRDDRRDLWERGRVNGAAGGLPCGAIAPFPPSLVCHCGKHPGTRGDFVHIVKGQRYGPSAPGESLEAYKQRVRAAYGDLRGVTFEKAETT